MRERMAEANARTAPSGPGWLAASNSIASSPRGRSASVRNGSQAARRLSAISLKTVEETPALSVRLTRSSSRAARRRSPDSSPSAHDSTTISRRSWMPGTSPAAANRSRSMSRSRSMRSPSKIGLTDLLSGRTISTTSRSTPGCINRDTAAALKSSSIRARSVAGRSSAKALRSASPNDSDANAMPRWLLGRPGREHVLDRGFPEHLPPILEDADGTGAEGTGDQVNEDRQLVGRRREQRQHVNRGVEATAVQGLLQVSQARGGRPRQRRPGRR